MAGFKWIVSSWLGFFLLEFWSLVSSSEQRRPENVLVQNSQLWFAAWGAKPRTLPRWNLFVPAQPWWLMSTQTSQEHHHSYDLLQPTVPLELCSKQWLDKHQKSWGFKLRKIPPTLRITCRGKCRVKSAWDHWLQHSLVGRAACDLLLHCKPSRKMCLLSLFIGTCVLLTTAISFRYS